jgi:hypothetical protein
MSDKSNVILNSEATFGITRSALVSADVKTVGRPAYTVDKLTVGKKLLLWGENNDFPQLVIADVRKNPELGTLLDKQANLLYSSGLEWGIPKMVNGVEVLEPLPEKMDADVRDWCKKTNISRYCSEAGTDLYWFNNVFPEIILSKDRSRVAQICTQAAEECRFAVQDSNGAIPFVYINAQWQEGPKEDDKLTKKIPVIDPYYDPAGTLRARSGSDLNFIYPLNYAKPGNKFYQLADWNAIRESGWLAVSELVPKFKKALLENQSTLKYHIQISSEYYPKKYPDTWQKMNAAQRSEVKKTEIEGIQALISGAEKSGGNFWSVFHSDLNTGKDNDLIKISALDDKIKSGQYLEEGKDASVYIMSAIGLHPALVGTMPNNGLGGAGSNIREAYNLHILTNKSRQDLILEPLNNLIVEYNGWDPKMIFRFKNSFMTTLDTNKETSNTPQTQTSAK